MSKADDYSQAPYPGAVSAEWPAARAFLAANDKISTIDDGALLAALDGDEGTLAALLQTGLREQKRR